MHVEDRGGGAGFARGLRRGRFAAVRPGAAVQTHLPQLPAEEEPVVDAADGDALSGFRLARQPVQFGPERPQHGPGVRSAAAGEQRQGGTGGQPSVANPRVAAGTRAAGSWAGEGVRH